MKDLSAPLYVQEEDIMRILKVPDIEHLLFEVRHMSRYIEKEFLFKVGLSFHAGRFDARTLKPTYKVPEPPTLTSKVAPKRPTRGEDPQVLKKKRLEGTATNIDKALPDSSQAKLRILEEVLNHQCIGSHKAGDLWSRLGIELTDVLNKWNCEFVKIKYLQGEFKRKYDHKTKESKVLEEELSECRTELANTIQSISLQNRQADQHQMEDGQMADVTWRSGRRLASLGGQEEDRRHSEVRCKTDIIWRPSKRPTSLESRAEDQRQLEAR
ncbi:hypothetical protein IEQ34_018389 [Dendrobium chrysotoxum]|uniref:Uncharacterized protein n=1 Tax=Dendrobium chrysotoxum TaxID=161865 RepID=A0AAV7FWD9_DENCH|nr:hypothetical protein IEQ34_018389 [Dendrobium chrysotoxum]